MLVEPLPSLTDLVLCLVTLELLRRLPRGAGISGYWRAAFAWSALSAFAGAVHHGFFVGTRVNEESWAITTVIVVVTISFLLAATVAEVLGRNRAAVFWPLRLAGLLAYAVMAATGHAGISAILMCESLTMTGVVALWAWAWRRGDPMGRPMMVAIGVNLAAACLRLLPRGLPLDPVSAYHLGQVVAMVLVFRAVTGAGDRVAVRAP